VTPAGCDKVLLVQAEFDGELDAAQAVALARHRETCPVCTAAAAELVRTRALLRAPSLYQPAPQTLQTRVMERLAAARPLPPAPGRAGSRWRWWRPALGGFGFGAAVAAGLAFLVFMPANEGLLDQVVAGHIRALQPGHLEDVASSDRHTVKPWFDGRLDFAPPVKDLAAAGFPLRGGRLDYLGGRAVAALVYQRDRHLIDLFVWPEKGATPLAPGAAEQHGYNIVHWSAGGMAFWAVSDVEAAQLEDFARTWRAMP
jgi:anti-sigma factor RsiW